MAGKSEPNILPLDGDFHSMAGHMDQKILNKNIQVFDESGDFTLKKNQPTSTKSNTFNRKKEPKQSTTPTNPCFKRMGISMFLREKSNLLQVFVGRGCQPNETTTSWASPKPFCRLSGDGFVLAKAQASGQGPGPEELGKVLLGGLGCLENLGPIFETYAASQKWDGSNLPQVLGVKIQKMFELPPP